MKVADDDWRFFISNDKENFDTELHKAEKILKKDDIPLKADLYTKEEADTKYAKTEEKITLKNIVANKRQKSN